jgi:3-deoxy-D-manno-octulosonate 8-phosphate phosphatase (KDO 8-P phosphatase)
MKPVSLQRKASRIQLLLFDVDGVLTDGKILLHPDGSESKRFDIRDGTGLVWAQRAGLKVGLLSARTSRATTRRAEQLGISIVHQGAASKLRTYSDILRHHALADADVAYMGDDILDLPVLKRAGLSACPSDAAREITSTVDYVSLHRGGDGAVRDLIEVVLRAQGRWKSLLTSYVEEESALARTSADTSQVGRGGRAIARLAKP